MSHRPIDSSVNIPELVDRDREYLDDMAQRTISEQSIELNHQLASEYDGSIQCSLVADMSQEWQ